MARERAEGAERRSRHQLLVLVGPRRSASLQLASVSQCTLRAAIREANAVEGADTITLPAETYAVSVSPINDDLADGAATTIIDAGQPATTGPPASVVAGTGGGYLRWKVTALLAEAERGCFICAGNEVEPDGGDDSFLSRETVQDPALTLPQLVLRNEPGMPRATTELGSRPRHGRGQVDVHLLGRRARCHVPVRAQ